jgi:hypothetical protein
MGVSLDFVKKIDKNYRDRLMLQPSNTRYNDVICVYSHSPCLQEYCALYSKQHKLCSMMVGFVEMKPKKPNGKTRKYRQSMLGK